MSDDSCALATVAVAYRQPEAAILVSMLQFYGIPAFAMNAETLRSSPAWTLALGGMPIRVPAALADEARALLAEVAAELEEPVREDAAARVGNGLLALLLTLFGGTPPPNLGATLLLGRAGAQAPPA